MNFQRLCFAVLVFATTIAVGAASAASCSNATLNGVFGSLDAGVKAGEPEATVTQFTADGKGNLSGTLTNSTNGTVTTGTFAGTYSISKNCTGSVTVTFPNGSTASENIVLDNAKKGAQMIRTDSGLIKPGFALAQGAVTCGANGKKQTFAANLTGTINGTGPIAYVGQVILDGKGNVSGTLTLSLNGTIATAPITGTYTENANCTGTAQVTPSGFSTANFNLVVVNVGKEILLIETDTNTTISGTMQQ
jgi:hypothetical protein